MLVLTRRLHERLVLPGLGVTIEVVAVKGNVVRLGIVAPPDVKVMRQELVDRPAESAKAAALTAAPLCHT